MEECLFCLIAQGTIPAKIAYQDDQVVAFWDINPMAPIHMLVVPRKHVQSVAALTAEDDELAGRVLRAAATLAGQNGLGERGFRLVLNHGPEAGQTVDHLHVHLLGGRSLSWPPG
jgi:histidine triad (HIT) family protein